MKTLLILLFLFFLTPFLVCALSYSGQTPINVRVFEPNVCGNEVCEFGETCSNCPSDCGICPVQIPTGGVGPGISIPNVSVSPYNFSLTLKNLLSFIPVYVEIPPEKNLSIIALIIETSSNLPELNLTIERILEKPAQVNFSSEKDYTYFQIISSSKEIFRLKFKFKVERIWFEKNEITNASQIAMFRLKEKSWEKLFTMFIHEDSNYYYYYSECWGLSLFSIGTYREEVSLPSCPLCPLDTDWTTCVNNEQSRIRYICGNETGYVCLPVVEKRKCEVQKGLDFTFVYLIIILTLVITLVGVFVRQKVSLKPVKISRPKPKEEKPRIIKSEEALKEKVTLEEKEVKPEEFKPIEVPKVEVRPEAPKLALPKKIKVRKIEDIVKKFNVGDRIRVKAEVALHAIGIPYVYKLEDDSAIIYGTFDKLIDRGTYLVEA
ncbi:MAG: PGF-pre-PGF domain-containing protein, partial [Candidatus Aenigmarchaeota archaeon]|nr:PGF-pre-PGF domain-containing protein [Candidatus Aenigmarchaeota archaeon]